MTIRKSVFSRLCNISRAAITDLCKKGNLVVSPDGKIDLSEPRNLQYLAKHNPQAAADAQNGTLAIGRDTEAEPVARDDGNKRKSNKPEKQAAPKSTAIESINKRQSRQEQYDDSESSTQGAPLTDSEVNEINRKAYYDSLKAKHEAQLKAVQLDKEHGSLGELEVFESFINELWQSLQRNYIDVVPKQAALICKRMGIVGHELEVIDVLEEDVKKRQDSVAREIDSILHGRLTKKVDEVTETE